ncbi:MAG TPA: VWA domain-containing protein [Microthrixaceae bacterium]|nr:VWA domain-containing protein [Microthrixaceae bacterium]
MRQPHFAEISPEVGELDPDAFADLLEDDPDEALSLLAEMSGATDETLRELARSLAGRIAIDVARSGSMEQVGVGRLTRMNAARAEGEIDLEASLDAILESKVLSSQLSADRLVVSAWRKPTTSLCLLVDRSGSMLGPRLAAAAVAAAAVLFRDDTQCSIIAFADDAVVLKSQVQPRPAEDVVGDLLQLRGFGVTNLALALRAARAQLDRSAANRKVTVVLSDCRVTTGGDAIRDAAALDEVVILAPAGDSEDAEALAEAIGARWTTLDGPSSIPAAFERLLGRS